MLKRGKKEAASMKGGTHGASASRALIARRTRPANSSNSVESAASLPRSALHPSC